MSVARSEELPFIVAVSAFKQCPFAVRKIFGGTKSMEWKCQAPD